ncbi:ATP-grasp domain-containing protein [Candidatus Nomurabacteria bacterium]|nr:ATP-grasp domain-containing protein [Candidatus Nomurabacteria bacterium]
MKRKLFNGDVLDSFGMNPLGVANAGVRADQAAMWAVLKHYTGRPLCATQQWDTIQLDGALSPHWDWIQAHYAEVGLSVTGEVVWDASFGVAAASEFAGHELDVFFFGHQAHAVRPNQQWFDITEAMNNKNKLIALCRELGVPTPETQLFDNKSALRDVAFTYPVYLKVAVSVSGLGVIRCNDRHELETNLDQLADDVPFQIQREVAGAKAFLNVQYHVDGQGRVKRGAVSVQILKGNAHDGNRYPTQYQPWGITDPVASELARRGMRGYFAFDVVVTADGDFLMIECNPRYNGATFPTIVAERLQIPQWMARNFQVNHIDFSRLDLNDHVFDSKTGTGVVVFNWGTIGDCKLGMLVAGTPEQQNRIADAVQSLLA